MVEIPDAIAWWAQDARGAAWLGRITGLAEECADRWGLRLGEPLLGGVVSLSLAVTRADGSPAVLKLRLPGEESRYEPDALELWNGVGAARLLERDDERWAMLLERLQPGTPLLERPDEQAVGIVGGLLRTLHAAPKADGPFVALAEVAARWADELEGRWERRGRPFERALLDAAIDTCRSSADGSRVVVHQDLHAGNVLRDGTGWRVIDPKPLLGEPEFDAAAILRDRRDGVARAPLDSTVRRRLDILADATGYDRERMRLWGIAHTLAWGLDASSDPEMARYAEALFRVR